MIFITVRMGVNLTVLINICQSGFCFCAKRNNNFSVIGNENVEEVHWISELNTIDEAKEFESWIYTL